MPKVERFRWLSIVLLLSAALLCGIPALLYPFGKDQGMFALAGKLILRGEVPYRDFWDVKPPGIFYVYALAESIFGRSMVSIRWLDILWQAATMLLVCRIVRRLTDRELPAVVAGVIYIASYWSQGFWNTAQPDGLLNLPLAAAVLLVLRALDGRNPVRSCCAAGALVGIAFYLKYPVALLLPVFCIVLFTGRLTRAARRAWVCVAAFSAVVVGYLAYLAAAGALGEFFRIQLSFVPQYRNVLSTSAGAPPGPLAFLRLEDFFGGYFVYPPLFLLSLGAWAACLRMRARRAGRNLIAAWGLVGMITLYAQGKFYIYHFSPLLPPLSIGAAFAVCFIVDRNYGKHLRAIALLGTLAVCALSWSFANPRYRRYCISVYLDSWKALATGVRHGAPLNDYYMNVRFTSDDFSLPADLVVSRYLAERTEPEDVIYIWGFEPIVYWLADRRSPSRFIHNFALRGEWTPPRYGEELLASLEREPPARFLAVRNDPLPWMTGTREDSETALLRYPALREWLERNYRFETAIEDFSIYTRKNNNQ